MSQENLGRFKVLNDSPLSIAGNIACWQNKLKNIQNTLWMFHK